MRIRVNQIRRALGETAMVTFESALGRASALWMGPAPEEGAEYDVEVEVPGVVTWGSEISETLAEESICEEDGRVCLVGRVQSLSDDGVAAIQLGGDVVLVELADAPRAIPRAVLIRVPEIRLFDARL